MLSIVRQTPTEAETFSSQAPPAALSADVSSHQAEYNEQFKFIKNGSQKAKRDRLDCAKFNAPPDTV